MLNKRISKNLYKLCNSVNIKKRHDLSHWLKVPRDINRQELYPYTYCIHHQFLELDPNNLCVSMQHILTVVIRFVNFEIFMCRIYDLNLWKSFCHKSFFLPADCHKWRFLIVFFSARTKFTICSVRLQLTEWQTIIRSNWWYQI